MMVYFPLHPKFTIDHLGYLPEFLSEDDPDSAREQLDKNYRHGGGYHPMSGWEILDMEDMTVCYPGDPPLRPIAFTILRDEQIFFYPHAFVLILAKDGTFSIARMD
jgi:hypothetical protein